LAPREGKPRKQFFFEKKNQKTFICFGYVPLAAVRQKNKVFWFFFSKKNCFLTCVTQRETEAAAGRKWP